MNLAASQGKATVVSPTRLEVEGKASVKLVTLVHKFQRPMQHQDAYLMSNTDPKTKNYRGYGQQGIHSLKQTNPYKQSPKTMKSKG